MYFRLIFAINRRIAAHATTLRLARRGRVCEIPSPHPGVPDSVSTIPISDPAKVGEILDKFRAKYSARDVAAYYPKQDVAVEVPLA